MRPLDADGLFARYRGSIAALPGGELSAGVLLDGRFALGEESGVAVHYAPFDYINAGARVVIVGLTPGWQQMRIAFEAARDELRGSRDDAAALQAVKLRASFAGMRGRLADWLDGIGVHAALGISSAGELFERRADLLHTTSAVRYPVFVGAAQNWSGTNPAITCSALVPFVEDLLAPELAALDGALLVPLGVAVQTALQHLIAAGRLRPERCLLGFPHPSGLNAQGPRRYREQQPALTEQVRAWSGTPLRQQPPRSSRRPGPSRSESLAPEIPAEWIGERTVAEIAHDELGVDVDLLRARFGSPGWTYEGEGSETCPRCGWLLHVARKAYLPTYLGEVRLARYWAYICGRCRDTFDPTALRDAREARPRPSSA